MRNGKLRGGPQDRFKKPTQIKILKRDKQTDEDKNRFKLIELFEISDNPMQSLINLKKLMDSGSHDKMELTWEQYEDIMNWYEYVYLLKPNVYPELIHFHRKPVWKHINMKPIGLAGFFFLYERVQNIIFGKFWDWCFSCGIGVNWEYLLGYDLIIHQPKKDEKVFISVKECFCDGALMPTISRSDDRFYLGLRDIDGKLMFPKRLRDIIECDPMVSLKGLVASCSEIRLSKLLKVCACVTASTKSGNPELRFERFNLDTTEDFILYWALIHLQEKRFKNDTFNLLGNLLETKEK